MNLISHIETLRRMRSEAQQALDHSVATQRVAYATELTTYVDALDESIKAAAEAAK